MQDLIDHSHIEKYLGFLLDHSLETRFINVHFCSLSSDSSQSHCNSINRFQLLTLLSFELHTSRIHTKIVKLVTLVCFVDGNYVDTI